jgi:hypothetical protein
MNLLANNVSSLCTCLQHKLLPPTPPHVFAFHVQLHRFIAFRLDYVNDIRMAFIVTNFPLKSIPACHPSETTRSSLHALKIQEDLLIQFINIHSLRIFVCWCFMDRRCGLVVRGPVFDSQRYQIFCVAVGLERGPLSLVRINEELLERKVEAPV